MRGEFNSSQTMNVEAVIERIKKLEPAEIERLCVLTNDHEARVRCHQNSVRCGGADERFEDIADGVFNESKALFRNLAVLETKERETSVK